MKDTASLFPPEFGHVMSFGPAVIYTVDPKTMRTLTVSANVQRELGYTQEEYLAPPGLWRTLLHPSDAPRVFASFERLFATGELSLEYRLRRKDGQWRWVRDSVVLRRGPDGEPLEIVGCAYDIEDRKRLKRARQREQGLFEAMFRRHVAIMLLLDPVSLEILDANDAAVSYYGWDADALRSMNFRQICQDGPQCHLAVVEQCRDIGCRVAVCRHLRANGEISDMDIRISRIEVGERTVLFAVMSDITASMRAQRALKESEARLRSITENAREGVFQSTMEGRFVWANPALARMLGYASPEELVASITDIGSQLYAEPGARARLIAVLLERGSVDRYEIRLRHRDGHGIWVAANTWLVREDGGRKRLEGVLEDITARKKAESERMLLATAVEQAVEGVAIVTGGTWAVEYANPAFGRITGLERLDILGRYFFDLFAHSRPPLPARDIQQALGAGQEWTGPIKDGKSSGRPMSAEAVFSPIRDESGRVCNAVVLLRDVASHDRLEKRLRRAQKLEAVGTLAGGIAHDFNNILTPILLNAEVGMQLLNPGDILRRPLEEILQAGGRARQLIKQILVFSRRGDLRAARIELGPIVREALRLLRPGLPPDVDARMDPGEEPLEILADPSLVHQMVINLADNAVHSMQGKGGTLTIGLTRREVTPGGGPSGRALVPGGYAVLSVADTGHGMDKALMERIFTPFFTTKRPGEGTGMGLSTVHGTVRSLGGGVFVESELGKGSRFEVYLPLAGPGPAGKLPSDGRRVLVVDTQAFSRRALAMTLSELGYKATMMRDAAKALSAFSRVGDRFDAVLAGEDLHGMSGRSFLESCRGMRPGVRLVLLTDRDESGTLTGGADLVLQKPVSALALAGALADQPSVASEAREVAGSVRA
ncbi:hybrid sensor histidine kinase/response regulator [Fundidesulfovibrio terrae]|uniref:hybrid sensor histidine kinase/response regulator n=1 Tax=Fundidesulfovibrio terrae TaxID=2922866 RepID=UPI001FAF541A|nr:PAS domain S-box protein [Fundidesulfovibrio terrae]